MDYFNVSISDFLRNALLIFAVIGVAILYLLVSHYRKRKLYSVLELDTLPQSKIWLRPSSVGHLVNVLFSFLFWFTASVFSFSVYIVSKNIMILALSLLVLFGGFLMVNRKVVKEGKLAVKYRIDEGIKNDVYKSFIIKRFGNVHVGTNMNIMRPIGTSVYVREERCLLIMVVSIFKV